MLDDSYLKQLLFIKTNVEYLCSLSVITQFPTIKVCTLSFENFEGQISVTLVSAEISCIYLAIVAINNAAVPNALQMSQH